MTVKNAKVLMPLFGLTATLVTGHDGRFDPFPSPLSHLNHSGLILLLELPFQPPGFLCVVMVRQLPSSNTRRLVRLYAKTLLLHPIQII